MKVIVKCSKLIILIIKIIKKIIVYKIWSNTSKIKILEKLVINMIKYGNFKTNFIFLIIKLIIKIIRKIIVFLNGSSKLEDIIKILIYVKIDYLFYFSS
jgi:hypothetical protein